MRLYYLPGACSLSPHIVANEAGIALQLEKVDVATKKTESGKDYLQINPKGYVPALELDNGVVLTEGPAIVQYLADQKPETKLAPANGTIERYQLQAMLTFIGTELHKTASPLFRPTTPAETRQERTEYMMRRLGYVDGLLQGRNYLFGDQFTVADAYLFVVVSWAPLLKVDISSLANVQAFAQRVAARPAVNRALREEGLIS
jgi:glutathione S-transferase